MHPIYCDIHFVLPSAFDILRYILSCRAIAIYDLPINLRYIYNRVSPLMCSHIGCIFFTFLHCVFSNESSNHLPVKRHSHIVCICLTFLHCVFSNDPSKRLPKRMQSHTGCISLFFTTVHFPMPPKITCM